MAAPRKVPSPAAWTVKSSSSSSNKYPIPNTEYMAYRLGRSVYKRRCTRQLWAGTTARGLFAIHAARALPSGPEGSPERAGRALGGGEGAAWSAARTGTFDQAAQPAAAAATEGRARANRQADRSRLVAGAWPEARACRGLHPRGARGARGARAAEGAGRQARACG